MGKQDKDRAERLAAALRENLRKRKAQKRDTTPRETQPNKEPNQPASEYPRSSTRFTASRGPRI